MEGCKCSKRLNMMLLPVQCSAKEVSQAVRDIVRVLRLRHKTLARAFSPRNSGSLTEFFSVQFLDLLVNIQRLAEVTRRSLY